MSDWKPNCPGCVARAKERNRDMEGMKIKAREVATNEQKAKAICWEIKNGLYIQDADTAIRTAATIRDIISFL